MAEQAGLFVGLAVFILVLFLPFGQLSTSAHRLLAILGWVMVYWITESIPVTALLGAVLCIVLGMDEEKKVLASFANPIIFLFMGSFMIAQAMRIHRLDLRLAYFILSRRLWVQLWGPALALCCRFPPLPMPLFILLDLFRLQK